MVAAQGAVLLVWLLTVGATKFPLRPSGPRLGGLLLAPKSWNGRVCDMKLALNTLLSLVAFLAKRLLNSPERVLDVEPAVLCATPGVIGITTTRTAETQRAAAKMTIATAISLMKVTFRTMMTIERLTRVQRVTPSS